MSEPNQVLRSSSFLLQPVFSRALTRMERNIHIERLFVLAHPLLLEDDRAGGGQLDADGGDEHQGEVRMISSREQTMSMARLTKALPTLSRARGAG